MKHVVVGTAGHIDHGKTALVRALTGINPDRLKEEQERGITIDIGFAPLVIDASNGGQGVTIGFVDVPGHEKFVKNMLAGIWGIDLVMLVIAADESIKPQTREHFEICSLLHVKRGVVALTKIDLVDEDLVDLVTLEIQDFVRGSFLEGAPVVPVSSRDRRGLEDLVAAIGQAASLVEPGRPSSLLRLPVDRSFSVKGFGTVVTGTLVSGVISEGDEVAVYPSERVCRVRGIQVHGSPAGSAAAGQRTAVNLQGIEAADVRRGDVLGRVGEMAASSMIDARIRLLEGATAPLKDLARVRFHQGASEMLARVKLLSSRELKPGEEAFAQIRLEGPGTCLPGDRFILRRYSPVTTIGGGLVLDAQPPKRRGSADRGLLDRLARLERADPREALGAYIEAAPAGMTLRRLGWTAGRAPEEIERLLKGAIGKGEIVRAGTGASSIVLSRGSEEALEQALTDALERYHEMNPLRAGMPREELREKALKGIDPEVSRVVIERLAGAGRVRVEKDTVSLATHRVILSEEDEDLMRTVEGAFKDDGLEPRTLEDLVRSRGLNAERAARVYHLLLASGKLVRIRDGKVFHSTAIEGLKGMLWRLRAERRVIDIGQFKEMTGTSRKNAIPLLEHLDSLKVTRRIGSDREILPPQTS